MPRLLETETMVPPEGGIFLSPGLVREETLAFADRYDDILADAAAARAQLQIDGFFASDTAGLAKHQKLVQEYFGLCGKDELSPPSLQRKAKLERLLGRRDQLMRRIGLAEDVTRVIRRNSEHIVHNLKRNNRPDYHRLGSHTYWLTEHEDLLGYRRLLFRCDPPSQQFPLIYFGDDALPVPQPGKPPPKFPIYVAPYRLAGTTERIELLHDVLASFPETRESNYRPAPQTDGEQRIMRLMGELVISETEI